MHQRGEDYLATPPDPRHVAQPPVIPYARMTPAIGRTVLPATDRSGKVKITTLLLLVVIAAAVYCGIAFGKVYYHRYAIKDAIDQQLGYAGQLADETIRSQLVEKIADMNLPPAASRVRMVRTAARSIRVTIAYTEDVNLLFTHKKIPVTIVGRRKY